MKRMLPITYKPKEAGIRDGSIRQTFRKDWKFIPGDEIGFYGWVGKPYRSKWSFKTEYFTVRSALPVVVSEDGIEWYIASTPDEPVAFSTWDKLNDVAKLDGIDPPTGTALRDVLLSNGVTGKSQIIRW